MLVCDVYNCARTPLQARHEGTKVTGINRWLPPRVLSAIANKGVGVEIEIENCTAMVLGVNWNVVNDNSLRNAGQEYVTRYGHRVGKLYESLSLFHRCIAARQARNPEVFKFSERTSVHVHLDCRQFNEDQLESLIVLYTLVENPLFSYAGDARKHNIFCVPLRQSPLQMERDIWRTVEHWEKYCAINLKCLQNFGTVEFRHMEGNLDPERIFNWVMLLSLIHDAARRLTTREVRNMVNGIKVESQYHQVLSDIFFDYLPLLQWDERDVDSAASDSKMFFSNKEGI